MYRDEVGVFQDLIDRLGALYAHLTDLLVGDVRVVGEHPHPHAQSAASHDGPDVPEAHEPERLLRDLHALEVAALPRALAQRGVRRRNVSGAGQHKPERVLGGGDGVGLRGVGDEDAALGGGLDVYVVHPDARAADGLHVVGALYYVRRHLCGAADYEAVVLADLLQKLLFGEVEQHVHLEVLLEQLYAALGQLLGYQYLHAFTPLFENTFCAAPTPLPSSSG